jgi:hypothetical protein
MVSRRNDAARKKPGNVGSALMRDTPFDSPAGRVKNRGAPSESRQQNNQDSGAQIYL